MRGSPHAHSPYVIQVIIMAKATQPRSSGKAADAITLLKQDHRAVEALFQEFEKSEDTELGPIAERVCQMLTVHAQIEEEILYPAAKDAFEDEEDTELVNEAAVEHGSAKELIEKIEAMSEDDELFKATVTVLSEYIKHHVKEEEQELFPKLKEVDVDLEALGAKLQARKSELMEEMDVEESDDESEKASGDRGNRTRGNSRPRANAKPSDR
jgi:hemerythrin superfamily protein